MKISKDTIGKSGIYYIKNINNNKLYIGSSKNIYYRLHRHKSDMIKNKHHNIIIQNSFNKNGINSFELGVIEYCDEEDLIIKEQHYIDTLNPEYNITKIVERNTLSESSKLKISKTLKDKYKNKEIKGTVKAIDLYDLDGNFIRTYNSCKECAEDLKISPHTISNVLSGKCYQGKGYIFTKKGIKPNLNKKVKLGVKVRITCNEWTKEFRSFSEAAKYIGTTVYILNRHYHVKGFYKQYTITTCSRKIGLNGGTLDVCRQDNPVPSLNLNG